MQTELTIPRVNGTKTLKIGTLKYKKGPNRDLKRQKGPYVDLAGISNTDRCQPVSKF